MMFETRKILGDESIAIAVTCARVPVHNSHSESVNARDPRDALGRGRPRAARGDARARDRRRPDASTRYPTALAGRRPRRGVRRPPAPRPAHPRGLQMWVVSDNLLKGAATNAVQIAEVLHARGLVARRRSARFPSRRLRAQIGATSSTDGQGTARPGGLRALPSSSAGRSRR